MNIKNLILIILKKFYVNNKKGDGGITNHMIVHFFKKEEIEDIKKIFNSAYPSSFVINFSYYYERKQQSRTLFFNNEYTQNRQKRYALVELDIHQKKIFFSI